MRYSLRAILIVVAGVVCRVDTALAQQALSSEPPSMGKGNAPRPASLDSAPTVAPSAKVLSPVLTKEQAERRLSELKSKLGEYQSKIGLGGNVLSKWAGTAELHTKYAQAASEAWAHCDLIKDRYARAKSRGMSDALLGELSQEKTGCDIEVSRQQAAIKLLKVQLDAMQDTVNRVDEEVKLWGQLSDENARKRKAIELERQLSEKADEVNLAVRQFDPKKK